jgi:hypothetical protein
MVDFCESYSPFHGMDVWSNKHEKGYNSRKNQPSVKSVKYALAQIMANQDTKYEKNPTKDK